MPTRGEARRHQVTELPPIEAHITEYQCPCVVCPECGKATQAELPREAQGQFGPQLTALIAYLTVVCRMPRRVVQELLGQVLGINAQSGQYSELVGRSQRSGRRALRGTGAATAS